MLLTVQCANYLENEAKREENDCLPDLLEAMKTTAKLMLDYGFSACIFPFAFLVFLSEFIPLFPSPPNSLRFWSLSRCKFPCSSSPLFMLTSVNLFWLILGLSLSAGTKAMVVPLLFSFSSLCIFFLLCSCSCSASPFLSPCLRLPFCPLRLLPLPFCWFCLFSSCSGSPFLSVFPQFFFSFSSPVSVSFSAPVVCSFSSFYKAGERGNDLGSEP